MNPGTPSLLHDILDYVNLGLIASGVFFFGVGWNTLQILKAEYAKLNERLNNFNGAATARLDQRLDNVEHELERVRNKLDRILENV